MTISAIKVKAYAVFRRPSGEILVSEVREKDGSLKGFLIPGGGVEFGEQSRDAMLREIREEIDLPVENLKLIDVIESIFTFQDVPGHKVIFIYAANFTDKTIYDREEITAYEETGERHFRLFWIDPHNLPKGTEIYPIGLVDLLK